MRLTNSSLIMNNSFTLNNNNDEILHVIYDYTSKEDDELTLKRGSILEVLSKDERISGSEGWWTGRLLDSESVGIFPANFVASSEPNLRIIDYKDLQIGELIGIGGFGHVHYGKFGDVDVAIKTAKSLTSFSMIQSPTSSKSHDDETSNVVHKNLIDSLLREARLFSDLKHRNIIQLFGVSPSISMRTVYLVMEYAHGGALTHLLERRKSGLYPNVFIQYAKQIVDGMKYLHDEASEHIIHRDLKCSNILILETIDDVHNDNELLQKTLKITDFGLARKQLHSSSMSPAGTFAWMSPECIRNNEFSTKSDVWSFGVLLWEFLTGEIPYKGFDQMQVAFGIATNKYSLPIPSTCPEEFSQLMKDCWQILPQDRPTFSQLYDQINNIIEKNYTNNELNNIELIEESYSSLQQDWRKEIQDIFEELKTKEQEIRDREQAMIQLTIQQNHQRMQLEKWEHELHAREMHIIECELKLLMSSNNNQERSHQQTPKVQKRSGHFMRSLLNATLNGNANLSSTTATNLISNPTNFRHLISVCRDNNSLHHHHHPTLDHGSSSTIPNSLASPKSSPANNTLPSNSTTTNRSHSSGGLYTSNSTPTTPNLSRLRTLTSSGDLIINKIDDEEPLIFNEVHFPVISDGLNTPSTTSLLEKSSRSSSSSQGKSSSGTMQRSRWRKSKPWSQSSTIKRKHPKPNVRAGEAKWYLETISSINTNHNTNNSTISNTESTSTIDRSTRKLEISDEISSSSSSTCSTPNDRSLARGIFDITTVLVSIGFGRRIPAQLNSSELTSSRPSSASSSTTTISKTPLYQTIPRSTSETKNKQKPSSSSASANTTPSPLTKKQHKRTCSSPITNTIAKTDGSPKIGYRARPCYSPVRPNSLELPSIPPPPPPPPQSSSSRMTHNSHSDPQLIDKHFSHRNPSTKITNTPEEDEQITDDDYDKFYSPQSSKISTPLVQPLSSSSTMSTSQPQLNSSYILDVDTEEQRKHQTKVLPPEIDEKKTRFT